MNKNFVVYIPKSETDLRAAVAVKEFATKKGAESFISKKMNRFISVVLNEMFCLYDKKEEKLRFFSHRSPA